MTARPQPWETFCDSSYFDMWCVRPVGENRWGHAFHMMNGEEAKGLRDLLTQLDGAACADHNQKNRENRLKNEALEELKALRFRMTKAIELLSAIQAAGVLEAHGHDDLNECLEGAIGALVGRKE